MNEIEMLIKCGQLAHEHGLVIGAGGNLSIREGDDIIIKKQFADMSEGREDGYIRVSLADLTGGKVAEASSEAPLHAACYNADSSVKAVVHVHGPYSIAVASKTSVLESPSYEFDCIISHPVPVLHFLKPGSKELGEAVSEHISGGANTVLLKNHGVVSVGGNIEEAFLRALALERASITFLNS